MPDTWTTLPRTPFTTELLAPTWKSIESPRAWRPSTHSTTLGYTYVCVCAFLFIFSEKFGEPWNARIDILPSVPSRTTCNCPAGCKCARVGPFSCGQGGGSRIPFQREGEGKVPFSVENAPNCVIKCTCPPPSSFPEIGNLAHGSNGRPPGRTWSGRTNPQTVGP